MDGSTIAWHGMQPYAADWSDESRLVAWTLSDGAGGGLYLAFNSSHRPTTLELPHWHGRSWQLVSDTGKVPRCSTCFAVPHPCCHVWACEGALGHTRAGEGWPGSGSATSCRKQAPPWREPLVHFY